jgi:3D (Asp-Asp-Asp) domain-containing protein
MRYFYTILILLAGMGLPVLAAAPSTVKTAAMPSSKSGTHYTPPATSPVAANATSVTKSDTNKPSTGIPSRFGRATTAIASWGCEGDYYTRHGISATGVRLHDGHCAVDPNIIPYGSVVEISGVGKFLAVDTGSAVVSRTAAREGGHNSKERSAIVVDLYFASRAAGERFAAYDAKYCAVSWWTPGSNGSQARAARSLFAEEDWGKIQSKQL